MIATTTRILGRLGPAAVTLLLLAILAGAARAQSPETQSPETQAALQLYRYRLVQTGTKLRSYPADAVAQGLEGTAAVDIAISADGMPARITLVSSSGHAVLDSHGLDLLTRAVPRTEIPTALHNRAFALRVALVFVLP